MVLLLLTRIFYGNDKNITGADTVDEDKEEACQTDEVVGLMSCYDGDDVPDEGTVVCIMWAVEHKK